MGTSWSQEPQSDGRAGDVVVMQKTSSKVDEEIILMPLKTKKRKNPEIFLPVPGGLITEVADFLDPMSVFRWGQAVSVTRKFQRENVVTDLNTATTTTITETKTVTNNLAVANILAKHFVFERTKLPLDYGTQHQIKFCGHPSDIFLNQDMGHQSCHDVFQALGLDPTPPLVDSLQVVSTWHKYIQDLEGDVPDRKLWLTFLVHGILSRSGVFREYLQDTKKDKSLRDEKACNPLLGLEAVLNIFKTPTLEDEPLVGNSTHFKKLCEQVFSDPGLFPTKALKSAQRLLEEFAFGDIIKPFTIQHADYAAPMRCHVLIGKSGMTIAAMDDDCRLSRSLGSPMDLDEDDDEWTTNMKEKGEPFIAPLCPYDYEGHISPIKNHGREDDEDMEWPYDANDTLECEDMEE